MSITSNEIEKYIFDPKNPKQCKSYKLLLKIAKNDGLAYVGPEFIRSAYKTIIDSDKFRQTLWDKPDNYEELNIEQKIKLFIQNNSQKEFAMYVDTLNINSKNFLYNNIFNNFFDIIGSNYIKKVSEYPSSLLKCKIVNPLKCDFTGYKEYKYTYTFNEAYQGHKILFTNNDIVSNKSDTFFDVSSILITTNMLQFVEPDRTGRIHKVRLRKDVPQNIKPIFLRKEDDVDILLNVLQEDLKRERNIVKENIPSIDTIKIENFYSIDNIELSNLKDKKEIYIVGENGDGKSLLLQAITIALVGVIEGDVFNLVRTQDKAIFSIKDSNKLKHNKGDNLYKHIIAYGASRYNNCTEEDEKTGYLTLFNHTYDLKSPIKWLQYLDYNEQLNNTNILSVVNAKKLLQHLLNSDIEIEITPDEVTFTEKGSEVIFEQLSAGYKGIVTIICDMIARLYETQPYVTEIKEFQGIVLIDEIELHLHPKWEYEFLNKLREIFPLIQFIVTTHSPTVLLGASKEAVFYKIYKEAGQVSISNQIANEGYTNNSLVSSPLFDMKTIKSRDFDDKVPSSDDYAYAMIHKVVKDKIKENINFNEAELLQLIDEELDKI